MFARDVMNAQFVSLKPENTIAEAVNRFQDASRDQGSRVFGLMVTDDTDRLVGMRVNQALATMLLGDMGRIFVREGDSGPVVGVRSLSDAANHRSGTCRACVSSRMVG